MIRFGLCGYGYRAQFYTKIAKDYPTLFEIPLILVKNDDEAKNVLEFNTTTDYNDFLNCNIDFVVNCTSKTINFELSKKLLEIGLYVLQETPFSIHESDIEYGIENMLNSKLQIAEQYFLQPTFQNILKTINEGKIGEVTEVYISHMHDYHAFSLIRKILNVENEDFCLYGKQYKSQITKTKTRYETFKTGELKEDLSKTVIFEFGNKRAIYNFSSEQYRSPIRTKHIIIKGTRGEIEDGNIWYLDEDNESILEFYEYDQLDEDYLAIKDMLVKMYEFSKGNSEAYSLKNAIEEAYVSIIMNNLPFDEYEKVEVNLSD